jgi:hypothetical protein
VSREERFLVKRVREVVVKEEDVVREEEGDCTSSFEVGLNVKDFGTARPQRSNHLIDEVKRPRSNRVKSNNRSRNQGASVLVEPAMLHGLQGKE